MGSVKGRSACYSAQERSVAGTRGAGLGGSAASGQGTGPIGVCGVVADGHIDGGARSGERGVVVAGGALGCTADGEGAGRSGPRRDRADRFRALLEAGIPAVSARRGGTVRTGA